MVDIIIKREQPHRGMLDADGVVQQIKEKLRPWTELLRDLTDYGSNLIPRAFASSEKALTDAVIIGLFRQTVAMMDAVQILVANGAVDVSNLQLRALFEASIYIEWILAGDSDTKADHYYVYNLHRKQLWARRTQPNSPEHTQFRAIMDEAGVPVNEKMEGEGKKLLEEVTRVLAQPRFASVDAEFRAWRKQNGRKPAWYSPLGIANLRDMATKVHREAMYAIFYSTSSEIMHSSNYELSFRFGEGTITLQPIRDLRSFETTVRVTGALAIGTFLAILRKYRGDELPRFGQKYAEKWRADFMHIPKIEINAVTIGPAGQV